MDRHRTSRLHHIARSDDFLLLIPPGGHAAQRMRERSISRSEVEKILKAGSVIRWETDVRGRETWRVAGRDEDGEKIEVVIALTDNPTAPVLVTVIRL
jgi:hypothetical protein